MERFRLGARVLLLTPSSFHADTLLAEEISQKRGGSAITLRLEDRLVCLVFLDAVEVDVEQVGRILRTALGFRMELGAEDGSGLVDQTCENVRMNAQI